MSQLSIRGFRFQRPISVLAAIVSVCGAGGAGGCTINNISAGDGGTPSSDAASTSDGNSSADGGHLSGGCDFGEPNNDRDHGTPITLNASYTKMCVSGADGADFFEIVGPNDVAGGYVEVSMTNVGDASPEMEVFAVADQGKMFDTYTTTRGASLYGWFTVSPGAKYQVKIREFAATGPSNDPQFTYDLNVKYTPLNDKYEPNDKREDAKPISLATPILASGVAVSPKATPDNDDDWYKVTLAAGMVTVVVKTPADTNCDVKLYDAANAVAGGNYQVGHGTDCTFTVDPVTPGDYTLVRRTFGSPAPTAGNVQLTPDYVTKQYTLTVTQ